MDTWIKTIGLLAVLAGLGPIIVPQAQATDEKKSVCIRAYNIDHTSIPDDSTIIFHMRDGKVWKNTLTSRCYGLKINTSGFIYEPTNPATDEICSNLQTIRVRDIGNVCFLGDFTPVNPAAKP